MNDEKINQAGFTTHLTELRSRLLKSIIYLFVFFIICYFFAENIYSFLVKPYAQAVKDDDVNRRCIINHGYLKLDLILKPEELIIDPLTVPYN